MAYVITGLCLRHSGCVDVCPVEDCIQPGDPIDNWPSYYVNPETCIDCGACVPACPYNAIFPADELPDWLSDALASNRDFFARKDQ